MLHISPALLTTACEDVANIISNRFKIIEAKFDFSQVFEDKAETTSVQFYYVYKDTIRFNIASFTIKKIVRSNVLYAYDALVEDNCRKRGVASLLLNLILYLARSAGYTAVACTIRNDNDIVKKLLQKTRWDLINLGDDTSFCIKKFKENKCICDTRTLMISGCKCGGK